MRGMQRCFAVTLAAVMVAIVLTVGPVAPAHGQARIVSEGVEAAASQPDDHAGFHQFGGFGA